MLFGDQCTIIDVISFILKVTRICCQTLPVVQCSTGWISIFTILLSPILPFVFICSGQFSKQRGHISKLSQLPATISNEELPFLVVETAIRSNHVRTITFHSVYRIRDRKKQLTFNFFTFIETYNSSNSVKTFSIVHISSKLIPFPQNNICSTGIFIQVSKYLFRENFYLHIFVNFTGIKFFTSKNLNLG